MKSYIPEKITYVCSKAEKFEFYDEESQDVISSYKANPTWPVEGGKSLEKAINWAGGEKATVVEVENKPFGNVRVVDLESRGNGGRAYKVIVDEKFYVDLREDVLLSVILKNGIQSGGVLNADFVWYKNANHLKLINTDSAYYKTLVKNTKEGLHKAEKLKPADIIPGGIYRIKNGDMFLYLGEFHKYEYKYYDANTYFQKGYQGMAFVKGKMHLALKLISWKYKTKKNVEDLSFEELINADLYYINKTKGKPSYIQKIGQVEMNNQLFIDTCVKRAVKEGGDNPYPHNRRIDFLSLGTHEPVIHPIMQDFMKKIPIKVYENEDFWYDSLDEAMKSTPFVIK